ncbi:hypothetical protein [Pseudorhodoplanes sp.]|uniref:hypothetical protein n=1 Tax=Pseudorhodoplanes sp. TaxID=1934341 RepID=UPI002C2DAFF9|nr:hypothetical protein [Pseudorhodoplanes sp.]HWV53853.1 hypothetical protein [Pseudorhodoplanes sp.]
MTSLGLNSSDDVCPVPESVFGQLFRSHPQGLAELVATIPAHTRAMLAMFCYRRAHLHALGLSIASTCDEADLIEAGGRPGAALYELSRAVEAPVVAAQENGRRKITLAKGPLWTPAPLEDDYED